MKTELFDSPVPSRLEYFYKTPYYHDPAFIDETICHLKNPEKRVSIILNSIGSGGSHFLTYLFKKVEEIHGKRAWVASVADLFHGGIRYDQSELDAYRTFLLNEVDFLFIDDFSVFNMKRQKIYSFFKPLIEQAAAMKGKQLIIQCTGSLSEFTDVVSMLNLQDYHLIQLPQISNAYKRKVLGNVIQDEGSCKINDQIVDLLIAKGNSLSIRELEGTLVSLFAQHYLGELDLSLFPNQKAEEYINRSISLSRHTN